jgi:hypothetical protein
MYVNHKRLGQGVSTYLHLSAAVTAGNKSTIRVLATTLSSLGILDTGRAVSGTLSFAAPVKDPVVRILL